VRLQALGEEVEPAAAPGARRAQALAGALGGLRLRLRAVVVLLETDLPRLGGRQLLLEAGLALGQTRELADDLLLLRGQRLLLGGEAAVAGCGVLLPRLGDGALLTELRHLALQPGGVARQGGALRDQAVEGGAGLGQRRFELRDGGREIGELALA